MITIIALSVAGFFVFLGVQERKDRDKRGRQPLPTARIKR